MHGFEDFIAHDPGAEWVPDPDGAGPEVAHVDLTNSCAITSSCPGANPSWTPRMVALAVFDVDAYLAGKAAGKSLLKVVNILGFFVDRMDGNNVIGYLTHYPALATGAGPIDPAASFTKAVVLVR